MEKRIYPQPIDVIASPEKLPAQECTSGKEAVAALRSIYDRNTAFLREAFDHVINTGTVDKRYRAFYPEVSLATSSFAHVDTRVAYGHVAAPGVYSTTITRPDLFEDYFTEQLDLLIRNHGIALTVSESSMPIPLHFAFLRNTYVEGSLPQKVSRPLRDLFDVPDLATMDDDIVNGTYDPAPGEPLPLAPFTAPRVDYSLHRLAHYTATSPEYFQNFVLFTNYQFYIDEFVAYARELMASGGGGYESFIEP